MNDLDKTPARLLAKRQLLFNQQFGLINNTDKEYWDTYKYKQVIIGKNNRFGNKTTEYLETEQI